MSADGWENRGVAARWRPGDVREEVPVQSGRPPRMTEMPWRKRGADTEAGATQDGEFWRCRQAGCRRFAGPYADMLAARDDSSEHARLHFLTRNRETPARDGRGSR